VRPDHLFLGTDLDNALDKVAKGRATSDAKLHPEKLRRGEEHGQAKLTEAQVIDIRARYTPHVVTISQLADEFGVGRETVNAVLQRRTWRHLS
jgi:predicted DNA binding protein